MRNLIFLVAFLLPLTVLAQRYPSGGNASVGINGSPIPLSSDLAGAKNPSGFMEPLQVDSSGNLLINLNAGGGTLNTNVSQWGGTNTTLGQKTMSASVPVALASDQSAIPVSQSGTWNIVNVSGVVSLPTGASTSALQTTGNTSLSTIATNTTGGNLTIGAPASTAPADAQQVGGTDGTNLRAFSVDTSGRLNTNINGTVTVAGTVAATQSGAWNITNVTGTVVLPTGASTSSLQTTGNTSLATIATNTGNIPTVGQKAMAASTPVAIASDQSAIPVSQSGTWTIQPGNTPNTSAWLVSQQGRTIANSYIRNAYATTSVTTAAYVQLIASTSNATSEIEVFDSSGQDLVLATGGAGSEVNQIGIFPGGNGRVPLKIAAGTRVSVKAVSANATSGVLIINLYQ